MAAFPSLSDQSSPKQFLLFLVDETLYHSSLLAAWCVQSFDWFCVYCAKLCFCKQHLHHLFCIREDEFGANFVLIIGLRTKLSGRTAGNPCSSPLSPKLSPFQKCYAFYLVLIDSDDVDH